MSKVHPTAVIEEGAVLGKNVEVGPYSIISRNVVLEDDVVVKAHVFLDGHTRIGKGTVIWPGAVIGTVGTPLGPAGVV